ncbi:hypothetical protein TSAR_002383 [Trichomalopsis sarcophagae]|uniref:Uncharacterized protein n=1 Tax=Trichomalopsis sarcophagae TaxID=543379 RepID=A0A232FJP7_9HYME|nr:hypothetical protein TSAR_002383 [Trichomalopsis sarcophagae]
MIFTPRHKKPWSAPPRPRHRLPWLASYCYSFGTQSMHWQSLDSKYRNISSSSATKVLRKLHGPNTPCG